MGMNEKKSLPPMKRANLSTTMDNVYRNNCNTI